MQRYNDWIFMPASVKFEVSDNGTDFTEVGLVQNPVSQEDRNSVIKDFEAKFAARKARYVRVTAKAIAGIPKGHPGEGKPAWIFADEIVIE
jgi:hexosaminidase